ncbi:MAG: hypothetical protein QM831_14545 [Kofleriaceae bacterium]
MFRFSFVCLTACATAAIPSANDHNGDTPDAGGGQQTTRPDAAPQNTGSNTGSNSGSNSGSNQGNPCAYSGVLATFDLSSQSGSEITAPVTSTASGVTASGIQRGTGLTANTGSGSINASNWPTGGSVDMTKYFSFTVTAPTGCSLAISSLSIDAKASGTGPAVGAVGTDRDNFGSLSTISTSAPSTPSLTASSHDTIEIRVFGYSASGASGTFRIQNTLTVTGSTM